MERECLNCDRPSDPKYTVFVYETPWDDIEVEKNFCSKECQEEYLYSGDFSYFFCDRCMREICTQNPGNGWHIQYRDHGGDTLCLKCYQEVILENGVERDKFEEGRIPGMFFSYGNEEAVEAGYVEVPGFSNFYIHDQSTVDRFCGKALELIDKGQKVIVAYERIAIGGGEGYVTLMTKSGENR